MPAMNETHTFAGLSQKALSSGRPCFVGVRISDSTFVRDVVKGSAYRAIACKDPHLQFGVQSPQLQTLTANSCVSKPAKSERLRPHGGGGDRQCINKSSSSVAYHVGACFKGWSSCVVLLRSARLRDHKTTIVRTTPKVAVWRWNFRT